MDAGGWDYRTADVGVTDTQTISQLVANGWEVVSREERARSIPGAGPRLIYDPALGKSVWLPAPTERYYRFVLRRRNNQ
jgi:hypothetical protein